MQLRHPNQRIDPRTISSSTVLFIASSGSKDFSIRQWYRLLTKHGLERPYKIEFKEMAGDMESLYVELVVSSEEAAYEYLKVLHTREIATCHFQVLQPPPRLQNISSRVRRVDPNQLAAIKQIAENMLKPDVQTLTMNSTMLQDNRMKDVLKGLGFDWNDESNQLIPPRNRVPEDVIQRVLTVCNQLLDQTITVGRATENEEKSLGTPAPSCYRISLINGTRREDADLNPADTVRSFLEQISSLFDVQLVQISLQIEGAKARLNLTNLDVPLDTLGIEPNANVKVEIDVGIRPYFPSSAQIVHIQEAVLREDRRGSLIGESATSVSHNDVNKTVTLCCDLCGMVSQAVDGNGLRSLKRAPKCSKCSRSYSNGGVHFWLCPNTTTSVHPVGYQFCQKCAVDVYKIQNEQKTAKAVK